MEEIKKPSRTTYFICKSENLKVMSYGKVDKNQTMSTSHPIIDKYTIKSKWISELKKNNIIIL